MKKLKALLWLPAAFLLYWALKDVDFSALLALLGRLSLPEMGILLAVNLFFLLVLTGRWTWILSGLGYPLPLPALAACRLAGFAVSYLTPGPQFGGEPVQLLLAKRGSNLEYEPGSASLLLDKSFELIGNFAFLGLGSLAVLSSGWAAGGRPWALFLLPALLILVPALYLAAAFAGRQPLAWLARRLPARIRTLPWHQRLARFLEASETQVVLYCRRRMRTLLQLALFFVLVWGTAILEQWLALRFLGMPLTLPQTIVILAGAKLALLLPFPGALGALELTQRYLFGQLGYAPEAAISLALYIRARDLLFAGTGLAIALWGLKRRDRRIAA